MFNLKMLELAATLKRVSELQGLRLVNVIRVDDPGQPNAASRERQVVTLGLKFAVPGPAWSGSDLLL
jgi:hypothetical protein